MDDGTIDYQEKYRALREAKDAIVSKLQNHLHVLMDNAITAAKETHVGVCLVSEDHAAQSNLSAALHSNIISAGVIRQALDELRKKR